MSDGPAGSRETALARIAAGVTAVLAGFATMCLELTAVRLLAPFFGDSAYVWTNVIGVILVALAAGSFLGGRMADRGGGPHVLTILLVGGAALAAATPLLLPPLAGWLMDPTLPLDAAFGAMVKGSLAAGCLLFGPPVLLLGAVPPFLIKLHAGGDPGRVGRAGGAIYALGTLGGLAGTFLPTHVLVPGLGSRMTVLVSALVLLAAGLVMLSVARLGPRWRAAAAVAVTWILAAPFVLPASGKPLAGEGRVLAERESRYQYLRVVERTRDDGATTRALEINEGLDSFHSFTVVGSVLTGHYYDSFALLPAFLPPGERFRMVSLGGAAGTVQRIFRALYGDRCEALGVELDPVTVQLGREHLGLPASEATVICDARVFVALDGESFDLVVADTYRHQIYIPAHLASREFVERLRDRLTPGGIAAFNVGGFSFASPVVEAVANTVAAVFGEAVVLKIRGARNFLVLGRKGDPVDPTRLRDGAGLPAALAETARFASLPGSWRRVQHDPEKPVLRDDRPFLDRMHERMYLGSGAVKATLLACLLGAGGGAQDDGVIQAVNALRNAGELEAAAEKLHEALAQSPPTRARAEARVEMLLATQQPEQALEEGRRWLEVYAGSGPLHVHVGDALFFGRRFAEAGEHYERALADETTAAAARGRIRGVERERELTERAAKHEHRALWVVGGSAVVLALLLLAGVWRMRPRDRLPPLTTR